MKTILIEDWYAPEFRVRINAPAKCPAAANRRRVQPLPLFRAAQSELCRLSSFSQVRRRSRFASLQVA